MVVALWSLKGGAGTTTVAVALAAMAAQRQVHGALLVDLAGDATAVLGLDDDEGCSVAHWLTTDGASDPPGRGWTAAALDAGTKLSVIPRGPGPLRNGRRAEAIAHLLAVDDRAVFIDCGVLGGPDAESRTVGRALAGFADQALLVTRPCALGLRRLDGPHPLIGGVVLVQEPTRTVPVSAVEDRVGAPVLAVVPYDAMIAWSVEQAGLGYQVPSPLILSLCDLV